MGLGRVQHQGRLTGTGGVFWALEALLGPARGLGGPAMAHRWGPWGKENGADEVSPSPAPLSLGAASLSQDGLGVKPQNKMRRPPKNTGPPL